MAEDAAAVMATGGMPELMLPIAQVEISTSLAPFVVIYSDAGEPLASSGLYYRAVPLLPSGVFDYNRQNGEERVSWQPEIGVRIAAVVVAYGGALAARGGETRKPGQADDRDSLAGHAGCFADGRRRLRVDLN